MNDEKAKQGGYFLKLALLLVSAAVIIASIILGTALLRYDTKTQTNGELHAVAIEGEYSEEGGPWTPLTPKTTFQNLDLREITLRGHFTRDIPQGENLYLIIDHMWVVLRVNGEEVYRLVPEEGDGNPTQALGRQYVTFVSPGITTADAVELDFGNLYRNAYMIQFDELLRHMHTGNERMMLFEAIRKDGWTLGIGAVFLFMTLFLVAIAVCGGALRIRGSLRFLWLGFATLFSALWFFTLSPAPTLIVPWPVFLNVLYAFSMQGMAMSLVLFVISNLSGWRRQLMIAVQGVLLLALLVGLVNQLLRIQDFFNAINYFSIFDIGAALCTAVCLWHEAFRLKKAEAAVMLKTLSLLIVCALIELVNGYFQFVEAAIWLGVGLISFTAAQGVYLLRRIKQSMEHEKRALVLENEVQQSKISIMLSQIQPHFLYNTLNTIGDLCVTDPAQAQETVFEFSDYLRANMDFLAMPSLIPFEKERRHVETYLSLEKKRFEDRLNISYDIQVSDFFLPPLTIQPIVENAVLHGITARLEPGTLLIRTEETARGVKITVADDGVGFDPGLPTEDGKSHVGMENVRRRLETVCGGSLTVESAPGKGTTVTLLIPQRRGF